MGGGAAMRVAAKLGGIGVTSGGFRGVVPDHPVSAAARKAVRPVHAIAPTSSSDGVKAGVAVEQSSEQKLCREVGDGEFSGEPMPRLVFGGSPTLQEAKQATSELTIALDKLYLSSSTSTGFGNSNIIDQNPGLSGRSNSEVLESKAFLNTENVVVPSVPKHAIEAFRFLNETPAIQTVVASIASDPNVWNAVMLNPALQDYVQSQMSTSFSNMYSNVKESSPNGDVLYQKSHPGCFDVSSETGEFDAEESNSKNGFMDIWPNITHAVVGMMSSLSDFFRNFFGGHAAGKVSADTNSGGSFLDMALGPSIMGFVVMVIMVMVLKRA